MKELVLAVVVAAITGVAIGAGEVGIYKAVDKPAKGAIEYKAEAKELEELLDRCIMIIATEGMSK